MSGGLRENQLEDLLPIGVFPQCKSFHLIFTSISMHHDGNEWLSRRESIGRHLPEWGILSPYITTCRHPLFSQVLLFSQVPLFSQAITTVDYVGTKRKIQKESGSSA